MFVEWPTAEILHRLHEHQVPTAQVNGLTDVFSGPQVVHNDAIHTWEHLVAGTTRSARQPVGYTDQELDALLLLAS